MRIRTIQKLSAHREITPEGYLLCKGAALARTGAMRYLASEVEPEIMEGSQSEEALLYREAGEVFDPAAMASFEGKPLTLDHPNEDVDPENWRKLARGMVLNVRRGTGPENDLLLADILITDSRAIEAVKQGLCELSCGYDTKMIRIRPGVGKQTQIRGNHVALVENGRAGARCRINDTEEKMAKGNAKKPAKRLLDGLRRLLRDAENDELTPDEEHQPEDTPQPATDNEQLTASLEEIKLMLRTLVEALKPASDEETATDEDGGEPSGADDEEKTDEEAQDEEQQDEEYGDEDPADEEPEPGAKDRMPGRFCDAKTAKLARRLGLSGARLGDSADAVRRGALGIAMRDADSARLAREILGKTPLARASAGAVKAAFLAVAAVKGHEGSRRTADALAGGGKKPRGPMTPAMINALNAKFYGGK